MPKQKKPTFAHNEYEIKDGCRIQQIKVTNGCRYFQVDLRSTSGKRIRKNFTNAKKACSFASKSMAKASGGGIKASQPIDTQHGALEILNPLNASLHEAALFYAEYHGAVDYIKSTKALIEQFIVDYQIDLQRISGNHNQIQKNSADAEKAPLLASESTEKATDDEIETLQSTDTQHEALEILKRHHAVVDHADSAEAPVIIEPFIAEEQGQTDHADSAETPVIEPFIAEEQEQTDRDELPPEPISLVDTKDPLSEVWKPLYIPKNIKTQKTYTPSDVRRIMKAAKSELVPYLSLGMFGGLRSTEILKLRWRDVDFERAEIRVNSSQSKANGRRIVHLQPNLGQFIVPFRGKPKELVVPYRQENLQRWARNLFKELEISTIHQGARHSFAMYHLASHPLDETMQELGYTESAPLHKYYRGLTNRRKEQAGKYFAIAPLNQADIIPINKKAA